MKASDFLNLEEEKKEEAPTSARSFLEQPSALQPAPPSPIKQLEGAMSIAASQTIKPARQFLDYYNKERLAGREAVKNAYTNPGWWKTPLGILAGSAQYTFSPVIAGAKTFGSAVEEAYKSLLDVIGAKDEGAKKQASKFIGKLGEEAFYFVPLGSTLRAMMVKETPGFKAGIEMAKPLPKLSKEPAMEVGKRSLPPVKPITAKSPLREEVVTRDIISTITDGADAALKGNLDESKRIFRQVEEGLGTGEINPEFLPEILSKHRISPIEFAKEYAETVSRAGSVLGKHGVLAKRLQFIFKGEPEALSILQQAFQKEVAQPSNVEKLMGLIGKVENTRRGLLVTQIATAMRNAWSQVGRVTIGGFDDSLQAVAKNIFGGPTDDINRVSEGLNTAIAAFNRMSPKGRRRLMEVLDANQAVISKARLFSQPVHEVHMGSRVAHFLNGLNRAQEFVFRKIAFESKLRQRLGRKGLNFNTIDPKKVPEDDLIESVNYALEMTYAASPKSKVGKELLAAYNKVGLTLVNPFPRFAFKNALPFVFEHSPLGYLGAIRPKVIRELASGNPDRFAKAASRATIGTIMLDSAFRLRQSKYAGEKWYEIKVGEEPGGESKIVDLRAYAPLSTPLFVAEAFIHPDRLKILDYTQAAIGLNRIAGTGLSLTYMLDARTGEDLSKQLKRFVGQYAASFTVPARTASDIYGAFDNLENIYRDNRESPIAPIIMNIPKYSQMVPESYHPLKRGVGKRGEDIPVGGVEIPAGVFRQATGITLSKKNVVQREADRLGIDYKRIYPRTGEAILDRRVSQLMGDMTNKLEPFLRSKVWKSFSPEIQKAMLIQAIADIRTDAIAMASLDFPFERIRSLMERKPEEIEDIIRQTPARRFLEE